MKYNVGFIGKLSTVYLSHYNVMYCFILSPMSLEKKKQFYKTSKSCMYFIELWKHHLLVTIQKGEHYWCTLWKEIKWRLTVHSIGDKTLMFIWKPATLKINWTILKLKFYHAKRPMQVISFYEIFGFWWITKKKKRWSKSPLSIVFALFK